MKGKAKQEAPSTKQLLAIAGRELGAILTEEGVLRPSDRREARRLAKIQKFKAKLKAAADES